MVTPIDVTALLNTIIPLIFMIMIVSVLMGLVREFRVGAPPS